MKKIVFNGKRISEKETIGVARYSYEIIKAFDNLCEDLDVEILIPECAKYVPSFKNIKTITYGGKKTGRFWEQTALYFYLVKKRALGINLDGTPPIMKPDVSCKHDVTHLIAPQIYDGGSWRRKLSRYWHRIIDFSLKYKAKKILTLTQLSKKNIINYYKTSENRVCIVECAWQHMHNIEADYSIFHKYPSLQNKSFYFALGAQNENKNFEWILNNAKLFPENLYVIAGKYVSQFGKKKKYDLNNVIFLGYISDAEIKALMCECKAFIFPSFYEGFGIPPLEALSVGAEIIVSDSSCLPEIYEKAAHYINPYNSEVDLNILLQEKVDSKEKVLNKYSWENSAKKLLYILNEMEVI